LQNHYDEMNGLWTQLASELKPEKSVTIQWRLQTCMEQCFLQSYSLFPNTKVEILSMKFF